MRLGASLVELLVAVAIMAILGSITFAVIGAAKGLAAESACTSNLRQLQIAVELYRGEHDGLGKVGRMDEMGLPPTGLGLFTEGTSLGRLRSLRCSACPKPFPSCSPPTGYHYMPMPEVEDRPGLHTPSWAAHSRRMGERSILFIDWSHNPPDLAWANPQANKNVMGIRLDGTLERHRRPGLPFSYRYWEDLPDAK